MTVAFPQTGAVGGSGEDGLEGISCLAKDPVFYSIGNGVLL